jgi:hypothetical protein
MRGAVLTDRAEEHPGKLPVAAAAHREQPGPLGCLQQDLGGNAVDELGPLIAVRR